MGFLDFSQHTSPFRLDLPLSSLILFCFELFSSPSLFFGKGMGWDGMGRSKAWFFENEEMVVKVDSSTFDFSS